MTRVRDGVDVHPRRELLEQLVRNYHHLQNEHKRAAPGSRPRRRIEDRMRDVRERFDRLLAEWVPEADVAEEWRAHLQYRAPEPSGPAPIHPLIFRGENEAGAVVEIRRKGHELTVTVDGTLAERLSEEDVPADWFHVFRVSETDFRETFTASADAVQALAAFVADGDGDPPWDVAEELFSDGLTDVHFALTPRGRHALDSAGVG
jgi:hypothetical protein